MILLNLLCLFFCVKAIVATQHYSPWSLPLQTEGAFIVDQERQPVHLRCINWPGHMEVMLPEGLQHRSLTDIVSQLYQDRFNCVRLTFAVQMMEEHPTAAIEGFLHLHEELKEKVLPSLLHHNPWVQGLNRLEVFDRVIDEIGRQGLLVILDNHVSKAMWCCSHGDGNGWFNGKLFDVGKWKQAWRTLAERYRYTEQVIGFSLRNELRDGGFFPLGSWYSHMTETALMIHKIHPSVLLIVSGLDFDADLSFLRTRPLDPDRSLFGHQLVFEVHWYHWHESHWSNDKISSEEACTRSTKRLQHAALFLTERSDPKENRPLLLSEWGLNVKHFKSDSNPIGWVEGRYYDCVVQWLQQHPQVGWALWGAQGSYYMRDGRINSNEEYGYLSWDWQSARNNVFKQRLQEDLMNNYNGDFILEELGY